MKKIFIILLIGVATNGTLAQTYSIDWHKISGGGGSSSGGFFTLSGTASQHDTGVMSGSDYSLTGGFWAFMAVPAPSAPLLGIKLVAANTTMIYWPSPSTGFHLQVNTDPATANWGTPAEAVQDDGTVKYIIVNSATGNRFYRLKHP